MPRTARHASDAARRPVPTDPHPVMPPGHETTVAPTRVCPRCGAGRMVVVAEFPPMPWPSGSQRASSHA